MTRLLSFAILLMSLISLGGTFLSGQKSLKKTLVNLQGSGQLKVLTCGNREISFLDVNTGKEKIILEKKEEINAIFHCSFFPDGKKIAYVLDKNPLTPFVKEMYEKGEFNTKEKTKRISVVGSLESSNLIEVFDSEAGTIESLVEFPAIVGMSVSPDGNLIAFAADTEHRHITETPRDAGHDAWLIRQNSRFQSLYIYDLRSKDLKKIVDGKVFSIPSNASWSFDDKKLLYETTDKELMVYDFETKSSRLIAQNVWHPSWLPNGRILFRHVARIDAPADQHAYYSINPDGTDKQDFLDNKKSEVGIPLLNHIGRIHSPIYPSPDGRYILFARDAGDLAPHQKIYAKDLETGETMKVGETSQLGLAGWHFKIKGI